MAGHGKISTEGGAALGQNPFAALSGAGLPSAPTTPGNSSPQSASGEGKPGRSGTAAAATSKIKDRGRVEIRRETGGRGGKTVTTVSGFVGIGQPEKEQLCKKMRGAGGCGGTVKDGEIIIQGDQRETLARILSEAGFRPVFAGG